MMSIEQRSRLSDKKETPDFPSGLPHQREMPAMRLDNRAEWVNRNILSPFNIEEGKRAPLALFISQGQKPRYRLGARPGHGRSGDVGKVFFRDKDHPESIYRDVDLIGCGFMTITPEYPETQWGEIEEGEYNGLVAEANAYKNADMSEKFSALGIRTNRILAILRPKELPVIIEGTQQKLSISALRKRELLSPEFNPVIEVRAFGTKTRISEIGAGTRTEANRKIAEIDDALTLVAHETGGVVSDFSTYLKWFAETLGKNLGLMHANGYLHGNLIPHNITLDCRLVDFDTVMTRAGRNERQWESLRRGDCSEGRDSAETFFLEVLALLPERGTEISSDKLLQLLEDSYVSHCGYAFPPMDSMNADSGLE
jgi:hypothetical protein